MQRRFLLPLLLLGILPILFLTGGSAPLEEEAATRPNIILITVEATPAAHLPCYGYSRNTSPAWCGLADDGVLYTRAYTPGTYTPLALTGIETGHFPFEVGVYGPRSAIQHRLLSERLAAAGYQLYMPEKYHPEFLTPDSARILDEFAARMRREAYGEVLSRHEAPVFIRDHIFFTHDPYLPIRNRENGFNEIPINEDLLRGLKDGVQNRTVFEQVNDTERRHIVNAYDETLYTVDRDVLGPLLQQIKASGEWNNTLIAVTADHGEMLGRDGLYLHLGPYDQSMRVPLVVKYPGGTPQGTVDRLVSTIDLYPTILSAAGIPYNAQNTTGLPLQSGSGHGYVFVQDTGLRAVINTTHKLVRCRSISHYCWERSMLFRYQNGTDIRSQSEGIRMSLSARLTNYLQQHRQPEITVNTSQQDEVLARLQELGYLE